MIDTQKMNNELQLIKKTMESNVANILRGIQLFDDRLFQFESEISKNDFRLIFDAQIVKAHQTAREHGWHEEERNDGECLALIHSEVSEALQALRAGNPRDKHCPEFSALEVELADTIIRIMDYAGLRNLDIAGAILAKMEYNQTRPHKHGKKF